MTDSVFIAGFAGFFGLLIGSFLNVVIYRLPKMLERQWEDEHAEFSGKEPDLKAPFNLMLPKSHCLKCGRQIRWYENILELFVFKKQMFELPNANQHPLSIGRIARGYFVCILRMEMGLYGSRGCMVWIQCRHCGAGNDRLGYNAASR